MKINEIAAAVERIAPLALAGCYKSFVLNFSSRCLSET